MAEAHERNVRERKGRYMRVDGGYTSNRNAHGCSMAVHAPDGAIVACEHSRLTDEGAKSWRSLERHVYGMVLTLQFQINPYL